MSTHLTRGQALPVNTLKILLVEDNPTLARQTGQFLEGHGWHVDFAGNGQLGLQLALQEIYDLILLDLNLPDIDGLEVCRQLREKAQFSAPILMLTARDAFTDKAEGFDSGADDYLCKPFDPRELALRCRALARRWELHRNDEMSIGPLHVHRRRREAARDGQTLKLTTIAFNILWELACAYPEPLSRGEIVHRIWGDNPPDSDALKSHIYSLRRQLDRPFPEPMLRTISSIGFQLELPRAS
ncbi:response regulator transcription factor [Microbulbifer agarilyticus]|uniref:response regulator transcription factor n=1 Tax=Microbulbifer agarilyticus TaxID=260552 RepID=UPI001CD6B31B|nr:response regulator transcription factor [Microbulbifer agarilyticus]MCA0899721.1 response regulator transcription factor [Microbulbifer agarilyticus]